jgi:sterol desaturase/sphingolipid hydroxylase (fatty acid hydroxylase superfamily)
METFQFLDYFDNMPSWLRLAWLIGCIAFAWILEGIYPLFKNTYNKWGHAKTNFILLSFTMLINLAFGVLTLGVFDWIKNDHIGLLYLIHLPAWANLLITIMWLDLVAQYFIHYLLHKLPWMWKFHVVHHNDTHLDATSATRHHPGDFITRELFALIACILIGAPVSYYFFYRFITIPFGYLTHSNTNVPVWIDKTIGLVFITPNMHKFHHHYQLPWTDSNYGNIFSFWDRIFRTLVVNDPRKIRYGLDTLIHEEKNVENVKFQLSLPFMKDVHKKS